MRIRLPWRASLEALNKILLAFLKAGAESKPVHYSSISKISGIHEDTVRKNCPVLESMGFLVKVGKGEFQLKSEVVDYVKAVSWGREDEAKAFLKQILLKWEVTKKIVDRMSIERRIAKDEFIPQMAKVLDVARSRDVEDGLSTIRNMMLYTGILNEEGGMICYVEPSIPVHVPEGTEILTEDLEELVKEVIQLAPIYARDAIRGRLEYERRREKVSS